MAPKYDPNDSCEMEMEIEIELLAMYVGNNNALPCVKRM